MKREEMDNFYNYFQAITEENSQYLVQLNIDNTKELYSIAKVSKNAKDLQSLMIAVKNKFPDKSKIDWKEVNWEEVYSALDESTLSPKQKAYQSFFISKLKKYKVSSPADLDDGDIKKFFNEISNEWSKHSKDSE